MSLDLSQFLSEVKNASNWQDAQRGIFQMLSQMQEHVNNGFDQLGVTTMSKTAAPDAPQNLTVKANNGVAQFVVTHNSPINKTDRYFVEMDTDPAFSQPHVVDLGASRTGFATLPNTDDSSNPQPWHFRTFVQRNGSPASAKVNFGPQFNPTPVTVGGTTQFTPIPSTGSGTGAANGQQGGVGLGTNFYRPQKIVQRGVRIS